MVIAEQTFLNLLYNRDKKQKKKLLKSRILFENQSYLHKKNMKK